MARLSLIYDHFFRHAKGKEVISSQFPEPTKSHLFVLST